MTKGEKNILLLTMAGFAVFGAWLIHYNPEHMNFVCQEDGFVEYSQFFLYLFTSAIFVYVAAHKPYRNLWYWGYVVLFSFVAGEEVSWGQRIFDVMTPTAVAALNVQKEITIHNLDGIHQHSRLFGALPCFVICFVIPLTARLIPAMRRLYQRVNMPIYPLWTWPLPFIGFAFLGVHRLLRYNDYRHDQMGELYLGLGFMCFAVTVYLEARSRIALLRADAQEMNSERTRFAAAVGH